MSHLINTGAAPNSSTDQFCSAQLTLLCRDGFLGKRFFLDEAGPIRKEAAGNFMDFSARRFNIGDAIHMKVLVEELGKSPEFSGVQK